MPTYEFRCPKGHEFEKFYRSMSAAPLQAPCPTCGKMAERLISSGAGLAFKGTGFYITDYGKDGKKSLTPAPTAGATDSTRGGAEPGGAKSEPATKTDAKPSVESKASSDSKPATASKSAAKKSSGRAKSSE